MHQSRNLRVNSLLQGVRRHPRQLDRYNQFTEREVLPRLAAGPNAFYGADGKLLPIFRVHMDLETEFAADLRRLSKMVQNLRVLLEQVR